MTPLRILVLTSSTGGGHDARAAAFVRWIKQLYGWSIDVRVESMLEDSSALNRFGVNLYNFIQKHAPWLHHPYYLLIELLAFLNRRSVSLGRRYYRQVLENFQPHLVFSVHDCLNRGYFQEARHLLGAANVRCATYCSEFSGGYGYSQNWIEPSADLYISRTRTAADYAVKLGMPSDRIVVRGHLMDPRIYHEVLDADKRRKYRVENLGLAGDRFTVFLATGGVGANNHLRLLPVLLKFSDFLQVIVVCGRNHKSFVHVNEWRKAHPQLRCHLEGYCSTMHLLIQAADVVVTRGGTTTCAKALHYRTPILLNGFGGVMPQERLTAKFFLQDDASETISHPEDLERLLTRWRARPGTFVEMKDRFIGLRYDDDPKVVVRELVALAQEAARGSILSEPEPVI